MRPKATKTAGREPSVPAPAYYYASGKRIPLARAEDLVAIKEAQLKGAKLGPSELRTIKDKARPLRGGVILIRSNDISPATREALATAGAVHPVFRSQGATIVALPEIRVEGQEPKLRQLIQNRIKERGEIVSEDGERIVLRPLSGSGDDAIRLANEVAEELGPAMSQPRFLRIVSKPSTMR